jgi:molybdate transport system substrate-binding protein
MKKYRSLSLLAALTVLLALALAGCGGDSNSSSGKKSISVSAAASLTEAFEEIADDFDQAEVKLQFAGSDALAAQIQKGARPEVFAAANTKLPDQLFAEGLVEQPVAFATNTLVIAVPKGSSEIKSIDDLSAKGVSIAAGAKTVPVGSYTRKVLAELPASEEKAILTNIKTEEPDVKGVVGKLKAGAVDAGFVYITDVLDADDELKAVQLPKELQPVVVYSAAVVKGAKQAALGQQFLDFVLSPDGQQELKDEGFGPPPS